MRFTLMLMAMFSLSSMVIACGPSSSESGIPPEPSSQCGEGASPSDGQDVVWLGRPDNPTVQLMNNEILLIQHGSQGGQHVFVGVRHFSSIEEKWIYRITFMGQGNSGEITAPVKTCTPGWTDSIMPVFLTSDDESQGPLWLLATQEESGVNRSFEVMVQIQ